MLLRLWADEEAKAETLDVDAPITRAEFLAREAAHAKARWIV